MKCNILIHALHTIVQFTVLTSLRPIPNSLSLIPILISNVDIVKLLICSAAGPVGSDIPEDVVNGFPLERVRETGPQGLLQPGVQCRICLHAYQVGQYVRKLPNCKHKVRTHTSLEGS